jgi:hypothetical protein
MKLSEEIKKAVQTEIRKDCWGEAKMILSLTTDKNREDFLQYHKEDKGNICCLVLDFAKQELVKENKMIPVLTKSMMLTTAIIIS